MPQSGPAIPAASKPAALLHRRPAPRPRFSWVTAAGLFVIGVSITLTGVLLYMASHKAPQYSQASPEDLIHSAVTMVRSGEASKLSTLFYAETPEMRSVLKRLGGLLGSLQDLGAAVAKRFPQDVAKLREEAAKKAASAATSSSLLSGLQNATRRRTPKGANSPPGAPPESDEKAFQDLAMSIFADPFGMIERNADRLTAVSISDEQAAVMLDGKPVPPVGLTLRKADGRWQIELPTSLPGVSQFMPQTRAEHSMIGSLVKVIDNAVKELAEDVRAGRVGKVGQLAEKAGEKAFPPAAMVVIAYGKEMDVRTRREKAMGEYRKRQAQWLEERPALREALGDETTRKFKDTLDKLAVEELDKLVRADSLRPNKNAPKGVPKFAELSAPAFETTLEGWLMSAGASSLRLSESPGKKDVDQALAAIEAAGKKQVASKSRR